MARSRDGVNTLAYLGVKPQTPPNTIVSTRAPTTNDVNHNIADFWLDRPGEDLYILTSLVAGFATWVLIGGGVGTLVALRTDDGAIVMPNAGIIDLDGGSNINTTGATPVATVSLNDFIVWPATDDTPPAGYIEIGGAVFMHAFGLFNTFLGSDAGNFTLTSSIQNTGIGAGALQSLTTGDNNFCGGFDSGTSLTTGGGHCLIGANSGETLSNATECIAIGFQSLPNATNSQNVIAIGTGAGLSYIAGNSNNIVIDCPGVSAENDTIRIGGSQARIAIGGEALDTSSTGTQIAIGFRSLQNNIDSERTVSVGNSSLASLTEGNDNTAIGSGVANGLVGPAENNIIIGSLAGLSYTTTESNNITIGSFGDALDNGVIRIGRGVHTSAFIQGIYNTTGLTSTRNVVVQSDGQLGTGGSDGTPNAFFAYLTTGFQLVGIGAVQDYALGSSDSAFTEVFDDGGNFFPGDAAGTAASFTAPSDGKYIFNFFMSGFYNPGIATGGSLVTAIIVNGGASTGLGTYTSPNSNTNSFVSSGVFSALLSLTAGDIVEFHHIQFNISAPSFTQILGGITNTLGIYGPTYVTWISGYQVSS